jgi:hypothetical protein
MPNKVLFEITGAEQIKNRRFSRRFRGPEDEMGKIVMPGSIGHSCFGLSRHMKNDGQKDNSMIFPHSSVRKPGVTDPAGTLEMALPVHHFEICSSSTRKQIETTVEGWGTEVRPNCEGLNLCKFATCAT